MIVVILMIAVIVLIVVIVVILMIVVIVVCEEGGQQGKRVRRSGLQCGVVRWCRGVGGGVRGVEMVPVVTGIAVSVR